MQYRDRRMGPLLQKELSALILRELEFDGALPTITEVEMSKKLDHARVSVSVWPSEKTDEVLRALNNAQGELRHALGKKFKSMRVLPAFKFVADYGHESAAGVEKALMEE